MRNSSPRIDLTGQRFGRLIANEYGRVGQRNGWWWLCDCGTRVFADARNVKSGNTSSCGCLRNELSAQRKTKHGLCNSGSIAYRRWERIRHRVTAKTGANYRDYAAKGISMCQEWLDDPAAFVAHIGEPPSPDYTVDRIDNAKGYEPGNVRWATKLDQANNKTNNRIVEYRGQRMTLSQMIRARATDEGLPESTVRRRVERQLYGGEVVA